tara:strand:- start:274 stop:918 length:645 start_codon:yes stop_codon:yes gene_type:complete
MALPLMPKATAVWLLDNTSITFEQIGDFTGMHHLEVQAIADEEVAIGIVGVDPIANGQLTAEEIKKAETKESHSLKLKKSDIPKPKVRAKGARYTPVSKRQERPDAIAWLLRNHSELLDSQISRLLGTTKNTITAIRDKTHWDTKNIEPQNPVTLGLCTEAELKTALIRAEKRLKKAGKAKPYVDTQDESSHTEPKDNLTKTEEITAENLFKPQ